MSNPLRLLTTGVLIVVEVLLLAVSPLALVVAVVVGLLLRTSRPARSVLLVACYLALELATIARIAGGVDDWDELVRRTLQRGLGALSRSLDLELELEPGSATAEALHTEPGVVVLARHSGPGDSVLIAWLLTVRYGLRIRVVLKAAMRWEPLLSVASRHLPLYYVRHGSGRAINGVRRSASDLSAGECLLLFPEGGNFSWERRRHAIRWLATHGELTRARRAMRRTHTLPVRTAGAIAALQAAPEAAVLLLTHSGMSPDGRSRSWWRLPIHLRVDVRTLLIPAPSIPRDEAAITEFLEEAWSVVDTWVEGHAALEEFQRDRG
ncbi:MAG TPA: 1-acyl-sn-glycerol-3-phosphate acyltransferase [Mycobacteriales bacterium]|nr:1-acyl-sn-glycerol-3-phosphate acyltransferase [Mycobacteriales bacterium]